MSKAQEGEIIITESILTELEEEKKKEFLDINLNVLFLNKKYKLLLWGKRKAIADIIKTKKHTEAKATEKNKKDLSIEYVGGNSYAIASLKKAISMLFSHF